LRFLDSSFRMNIFTCFPCTPHSISCLLFHFGPASVPFQRSCTCILAYNKIFAFTAKSWNCEIKPSKTLKSSNFWDITPCSLLKAIRRFEGACRLLALLACHMLHACFLLGLFFDPKDGYDMFLRNVAWLSTDYTTLYPRR
jgi:hypothetical protein